MIVAIVQARMASTRLPGKTLALLEGRPLLEHVVTRARASQFVDEVVVATTDTPADRPIADWAEVHRVSLSFGSELDVLDRFYQAASAANASVVVRVTADDPFKDPVVIDRVVHEFVTQSPQLDYASNTITPTYPEGLDIEVFGFSALKRAWQEATRPSDREHVTPYIWRHPDGFRVFNVEHTRDLSRMRWTIDYEEDLSFAREVYSRLYAQKAVFGLDEIQALLEREPWIAQINSAASRVRNEGYLKTVAAERGAAQSES